MTEIKASYPLRALLVGKVRPLGSRAAPSGIVKSATARPLMLGPEGFEEDEQGDRRVHGGPEKAVHHYPLDHYATWRDDLGPHELLDAPGSFGENISTLGLIEDDVAIADVFSIGSAIVEVSQGRQPCWKLNERFGTTAMAKDVQMSGRTGWYYRVLQTGTVSPDDRLDLTERRSPEWTIRRIWRAFYVDTMNRAELEQIAGLASLAQGWRTHAARRLETRAVEDWSKRLNG